MVCSQMSQFLDKDSSAFKSIFLEIYAYLISSSDPQLWIKVDEIILLELSFLEKIKLINIELDKHITE
jgi:hypothetical protein